jgi:hypothetical protein
MNCARRTGLILLEVVLALALFAATVTTVAAVLGRCNDAVSRLEIRGRAIDLAVTLRSEVMLGLVAPSVTDPTPYEDETLAGWTWQLDVAALEEIEQTLRVVGSVRHEPTGVVSRLAWLMTAVDEAP